MTIVLTCPCGKRLQTAAMIAGREARCPACGRMLQVPDGRPDAFPNLSLDDPVALPLHREPPLSADLSFTRETAGSVPDQGEAAPEPGLLDFSTPPANFRPYFHLHSPLAMAAAALLGGALAGCLLLAMNFRALRRAGLAFAAVLLGVAIMGGLLVAAQVAPALRDEPLFSSLAVFVPSVALVVLAKTGSWLAVGFLLVPPLAVGGVALLAQGGTFRAHVRKGGRTHGRRRTLRTALVCAGCGTGIILAAHLAFVGFATDKSSDGYLNYGSRQEVFYRKGTSAEEAHQLATALKDLGYFQGMGAATVALSKSGDTYIVSFCVRAQVWEDEETIALFEELRKDISSRAFAGQPVEVRLCDSLMRVKRTIK
jgi:hypothetical protein